MWPGSTSAKFVTNKAHIAGPNPDKNQPHPLYSMDGRTHFKEQRCTQNDWKPSLKTGIEPNYYQKKAEAVKHIDFKPIQKKGQPERAHLRDAHPSMLGPTNDNPK